VSLFLKLNLKKIKKNTHTRGGARGGVGKGQRPVRESGATAFCMADHSPYRPTDWEPGAPDRPTFRRCRDWAEIPGPAQLGDLESDWAEIPGPWKVVIPRLSLYHYQLGLLRHFPVIPLPWVPGNRNTCGSRRR